MGPITYLPKSLIAHLRSSFILSDFSQAIEELICNSLDAGAKMITASVDLASMYIKVEDDGFGINRDDLSLIGERNATSKLHDLTDLETGITTLGFRGEALSSLSEIAILEITSRAQGSPNTYKKIVKGSKKLSMGLCSEHRAPGTSVVLRDLFHNLPVRRKVIQSSHRKVLQSVKDVALRLALIHSDVLFAVTDLERQEDLIRTQACVSPLNTLCEFFGDGLRHELQVLSYSKENLKLDGYVSKHAGGFSSKAIQFLYVNRRFVNKTPIHKLVNAYSIINKGFSELGSQPECTAVLDRKDCLLDASSKRTFPAFQLDLSCPHSSYDITFEAAKTSVEFKDWGPVLSFVKDVLDAVWNGSMMNLDKGEAEELSRVDLVVPRKSSFRKRKPWQHIDPTYHPRFEVNMSVGNDCCLRDFESQSTACEEGTRIQDLSLNPAILLRENCERRGWSSSSQPNIYDDCMNSSWDLHHCKHKISSDATNSKCMKSKTKRLKLLEADSLQQNDKLQDACDMEPSNSVPKLKMSQIRLNEALMECRKLNELVEGDLQSQYNSAVSPSSLSAEIGTLSFYAGGLGSPSSTETLHLNSQESRPLISELVENQNVSVVDFNRNGLDAMEDEKTSLSLWKPCRLSATCVRRCLYDLYLKPGHTDDFLCHSERQSVSNFDFRQDLDRPGQTLERYGQSDRILDLSNAWRPWNKASEQKLIFSTSDASANNSHHEILKNESHELDVCDEECDLSAKVKHIARRGPIGPQKCHLKRSFSSPPFFKPLRKYATCGESMPLLTDKSEDKLEQLTAYLGTGDKDPCSITVSATQHQNSISALEGILASRTFQETDTSRQDEPQSILQENVNDLSSSLEGTDGNALELTTKELYKAWRHPYVKKHERDVLDLSSGTLGPMNKQLLPEAISKEMLQNAQVLQQLGRKFIAAVAAGILVVVDQHAADERIRLEQLRKEVLVEQKKQLNTLLDHPQKLMVTMGEQQLLHTYKLQIQDWGWRFKLHSPEKGGPNKSNCSSICTNGRTYKDNAFIILNAVPQILGEILSDGSHLSEYLRQLAITEGTSAPPPAILRVLATKACRGAIMFGDILLRSECQQLIEGLKQTALCFQCAHGRPTLVPLVNLKALHQRLGSLSHQRRGASMAPYEPVSSDQSHNLTEPTKCGTGAAFIWHGLQWHRPTLKRAQERLKSAQGM